MTFSSSVNKKVIKIRGTSLHLGHQRGAMGTEVEKGERGGSGPCPQLWPVLHVWYPHTFISLTKGEFHHLVEKIADFKFYHIGPWELLPDPISDLHQGVFALEEKNFFTFFLLLLIMKMSVKGIFLNFPPNLKNCNDTQQLRIEESIKQSKSL